ncbi:MAG: hypothetical protein V4808_10110 [Pseudomonadota bacterium]
MAGFALSDFSDKVGHVYDVAAEGGLCPLTLTAIETFDFPGQPAGFRLNFLGPADPMLPQGTYAFSAEDPDLILFIVPRGRDEKGVRYDATFN